MRGYLSVVGATTGKVPVESRAGVFRDPGETQEVRVAADGQVQGLDVADPTVSRKRGEQPPVVLVARDDCLEVRNEANTNGVTVRTNRNESELDAGQVERVRRDATLEIGYQTELKLTVEREAKVEVTDGDYVAGDKVERNTTVEDSVVNRSDVGADGGARPRDAPAQEQGDTTVEDSVVNRSAVGGTAGDRPDAAERTGAPTDRADTAADGADGAADDETDTKQFCQRHQRAYTDECPVCAREQEAGGSSEASFCIHCGERMPDGAGACPSCGAQR